MSDLFRPVKRMLTIFALLLVSATPCLAGSPLPLHTLEQIASKKSITLGYQDDAFPFSGRMATYLPAIPLIFATVSSAHSRQNFNLKI